MILAKVDSSYVCLIPITFPFLSMEGIKVTLRMAGRALRKGRAVRAPAPPQPAQQQA